MFDTRHIRTIALSVGVAVLCSACANDPLASAPMQLGARPHTSDPVTQGMNGTLARHKKTLSDKMLAASALERATGRKPHPTRFHIID